VTGIKSADFQDQHKEASQSFWESEVFPGAGGNRYVCQVILPIEVLITTSSPAAWEMP
jgi:hypothetical protein